MPPHRPHPDDDRPLTEEPSAPADAGSHFRAGFAAYQNGQYADALHHYRAAIAGLPAGLPAGYEAHWHAGACCHQLRRYAEAIAHYRRAVALNPGHALARYHLAKALKDSGDLDAALPAYQDALALAPQDPEILYSLGLLHLMRGDWLAGWSGYELRWQGSDRAATEHRPATGLPLWMGDDVPPESGIVIYAEQGMGDSIMCFRYARSLKERFARVKFAATAPLVTLFRQSAPAGVEVVPRVRHAIDETGYTHYIHGLSLPAAFKTTPGSIRFTPYLKVSPDRKNFWQQRLAAETRFKVGLVWRGGKLSVAPARDMAFEHLLPLLARADILWVSLQNDEAPPADARMVNWMNEVGDFADTAALIANLDWVIAVDTAVAHLAGALGKPVWLLNRFESEWRWMRGNDATPWYPSMRIFSQPAPGDWDSVIKEVSAAVDAMQPTPLFAAVRRQLHGNLTQPQTNEAVQLNDALHLLSKWRSALIQNTLLQQQGTVVMDGPLKGLVFLSQSTEGCHIPKLLGCYEQPLLPAIEAAIQAGYPLILNIGCAEGYYAVGMARRMPDTRVLAFDIDPKAQRACTELAAKNGVSGRVSTGALFKPEDFAAYVDRSGGRVLVLCDIEGGERDLLNPEVAPALAGMDLIVESHECLSPGITRLLIDRYSATHAITRLDDNGQRQLPNAPAWFNDLAHLDQLLAVWEWRSGPTPWLVMRARA